MKFDDIVNDGERVFKNISSESWRSHTYPGYVGTIKEDNDSQLINTIDVFIRRPVGSSVDKSGHYVIDSNGVVHFPPFGFIELKWAV